MTARTLIDRDAVVARLRQRAEAAERAGRHQSGPHMMPEHWLREEAAAIEREPAASVPPASIPERERALVREMFNEVVEFCAELYGASPDGLSDEDVARIVARVDATHPHSEPRPARGLGACDGASPAAAPKVSCSKCLGTRRVLDCRGNDDDRCPWCADPKPVPSGLREWFSRVLDAAAERGLVVSSDERGITEALASVGLPPTEPVPSALESACAFLQEHRQQVREIASAGDGTSWSAEVGATSYGRAPTLTGCLFATARSLGWMPPTEPSQNPLERAMVRHDAIAHQADVLIARYDERERCAKACDEAADRREGTSQDFCVSALRNLAACIRSLGPAAPAPRAEEVANIMTKLIVKKLREEVRVLREHERTTPNEHHALKACGAADAFEELAARIEREGSWR